MLRQYHTPQGIIEREPTPEELEMEFETERQSPAFQRLRDVLAELTGKSVQEVEKVFKKYHLG